jgi:putative ABC transport system permease protein
MIRAALKSLLGRKVRLLLSTFAIVLGVAFVAGTLIFSDTLNRSFTALFASTVGDVVVRPLGSQTAGGTPSAQTVPAGLVAELEQVDGVARVDGNVNAFGVYVVGEDGKVIGGLGPPAIGSNWTDAPSPGGVGLEIVEGDEPQGQDEVLLDDRTAEKAGYEVGDEVRLLLPRGAAQLRPTLVGLVGYPEGGSLNGATLALFDTRSAQELFLEGRDEFSDVWVTAADGVSQEDLKAAVDPVLPADVEALTGDAAADESADDLLEAIGFITTFLLVFAGISLVVGSFLIVNTFSILVAQRSRELALLRALGASRRQVTWSVQLEALVLGLLGSTIGLGLGVLLAMLLRLLFEQFGLDLSGQSLVFGPRTVVASYLVGVVVTMAAAALPARRTARIAPVQALRDDIALPESSIHRRLLIGLLLAAGGLVSLAFGLLLDVPRPLAFVGAGVLAILLGVAAASPVISRPFLRLARTTYDRLFGTVGNLAGLNSLRNPRRTAATASALMIGLALACTMAIVGDSAKASVDKSIEEAFVGDFVVSNVFGGEFNAGVADEMAAVEGVDDVVRERFQIVELDDDDEFVAAVDPSSVGPLELRVTDGSEALGEREVLLQETYADDIGLGVGDTLDITVPAGSQEWTVVGVIEDNPVVFSGIVTTIETFESSGFEPADNALIVFADAGPAADGLQDRLDAIVEELPIVTVKDQQAFAEERREPIDNFVLIIFALLGLALVIAVLGIVNTLALSIIERTREVGLLRAIGLSRRQLRQMIRLESVVIALLGAVLGVVMGIFFGVVLMRALRDEGLEVISVPWDQMGVFLLLSMVIGVLAAVLPARRAARLDVLKAIATE